VRSEDYLQGIINATKRADRLETLDALRSGVEHLLLTLLQQSPGVDPSIAINRLTIVKTIKQRGGKVGSTQAYNNTANEPMRKYVGYRFEEYCKEHGIEAKTIRSAEPEEYQTQPQSADSYSQWGVTQLIAGLQDRDAQMSMLGLRLKQTQKVIDDGLVIVKHPDGSFERTKNSPKVAALSNKPSKQQTSTDVREFMLNFFVNGILSQGGFTLDRKGGLQLCGDSIVSPFILRQMAEMIGVTEDEFFNFVSSNTLHELADILAEK
jgi:hypothetical protein